MDAELVAKFCNAVAGLIVPLASYAGIEPGQRSPDDSALVNKLRVAGGAINDALSQVARLTPPAPPPLPPPPASIGSTPAPEPETASA